MDLAREETPNPQEGSGLPWRHISGRLPSSRSRRRTKDPLVAQVTLERVVG